MPEPSHLPRLTDNARRLIGALAEMPSVWVTAAVLGESIGVSRRTVMRELPCIEKWLHAAGFHLTRHAGRGLRLEEDDDRRTALRALLDTDGPLPSRAERIDRLLSLLFAADTPVSAAWLAQTLGVSEHTLSGDLAAAGEWLRARGVTLERRAGIGLWLEGAPENLRRALGIRLRPQLSRLDWQQFCAQGAAGGTLDLLDRKDVQAVARVLHGFERSGRFVFSDSAFLSLVLHLTLLAGQVRRGTLHTDGPRGKAGRDAAALLVSLEGALGVRLPASEADYLAYHLQAAAGQPAWDDPQTLHVSQLAALLIRGMEQETGIALGGFSTFRIDLCAHLRTMLLRVARNERIENPQLDTIRSEYADLWNAVRRVCDRAAPALRLPPIPDEEAGFLAMHFGAVLDQCERTQRRLRTVVVCPTGMAASRFLTSQLDREFPEIAVQRMCALRGLDAEALRAEGIGLVISTVPLHIDFPFVTVSPVLGDKDRLLLQNAVRDLQTRPAAAPAAPPPPQIDLHSAGALHACLVTLIDGITIADLPQGASAAEILSAAAQLFAHSPQQARAIHQTLRRRESLGDTYIPPLEAHLLHGRTDAVHSCCLGYLRLPQPQDEGGRTIQGAVVMLAPEGDEALTSRVMQEVSAVLIDRPALTEALRAADRDGAARLLEDELSQRLRAALAGEW